MGPSAKNLFPFWSPLKGDVDQSPVLSINVSSIFPPLLNPKTPCPWHTGYCFSGTSLPLEPLTAHEALGDSGRCAAVKLWCRLLSVILISLHLNSS